MIVSFSNGDILKRILKSLFEKENKYGTKSVTQQGEEVKSLAEKRITDYFVKNKITYLYEEEARRKVLWVLSEKISRPDFYLPDYNVFVEYWGLVDADNKRKRNEYIRTMKWKLAQYHKANIKVISLYPSNLNNLDRNFRTKFKAVTGFDLPNNSVSFDTEGFCIRCGTRIRKDVNHPYCLKDYQKWKEYSNEEYQERNGVCHICGKPNNSSMKKPVCIDCFRQNRNLFTHAHA